MHLCTTKNNDRVPSTSYTCNTFESGFLSGDMSAAFPKGLERAEEVLKLVRRMIERADDGDCGTTATLTTEASGKIADSPRRVGFAFHGTTVFPHE